MKEMVDLLKPVEVQTSLGLFIVRHAKVQDELKIGCMQAKLFNEIVDKDPTTGRPVITMDSLPVDTQITLKAISTVSVLCIKKPEGVTDLTSLSPDVIVKIFTEYVKTQNDEFFREKGAKDGPTT